MTDAQAAQIKALRTQGEGYKAIASAVGLSRVIVRNYCRTHGMRDYGKAISMNLQGSGNTGGLGA